ncbi:ClpXP protease specificity-enhancing factor SspB, partial [Salmonella enterica subsp. enterica serovar Lubbock]|nr:ClpXP protease specificity-enhancing factor SspB [Salmonella enterica subsp. enterica serovar Lubbock]
LNIAPRAVGNLELSNDEVRFNARFGGVPRQVSVPLAAVLAIYVKADGGVGGACGEPGVNFHTVHAGVADLKLTGAAVGVSANHV